MKKSRTITKTEEYDVCDLCGEEINTCNGNTIALGEETFYVHLMDKEGCAMKLLVSEIKKGLKKNAKTS